MEYLVTDGRYVYGPEGEVAPRDRVPVVINGVSYAEYWIIQTGTGNIKFAETNFWSALLLLFNAPKESVNLNHELYTGLAGKIMMHVTHNAKMVVRGTNRDLYTVFFERDRIQTYLLQPGELHVLNQRFIDEWFTERGESPDMADSLAFHLNMLQQWTMGPAGDHFDYDNYIEDITERYPQYNLLFTDHGSEIEQRMLYDQLILRIKNPAER